jgi:hypothetical protein
MKIIAKCPWGQCPTIADPEDGTDDLLIIGSRETASYPHLVGTGEEMVRLPAELLQRFKAYLDEGK